MKAYALFFKSLALYAAIAGLCSVVHIAGFFYLIERFAWIRNRGVIVYTAVSLLVSTTYFAPIVLFPVGAYLSRNSIYAITASSMFRILLILVFMSASALFMRLSEAGGEYVRTLPRSRYTRFSEIVKEARQAPVEVAILRADLLHDDGRQGEIKLRLAINHIPHSVQSYQLEISNSTGFSGKWGTTLSAKRQDGQWTFHDRNSHEILTDEAGHLVLVHPFGRFTNTPSTAYPEEFRLRLLLMGDEYRVFDRGNIPFFEHVFPARLTRTEHLSATQ